MTLLAIERVEFVLQQPERPCIEHDVVQRHEKDVIRLIDAEQADAQHRAFFEMKWLLVLGFDRFV